MEKILITGGAGFVGSNLIRYLVKHNSDCFIYNYDAMVEGSNEKNLLSHERVTNVHFQPVDDIDIYIEILRKVKPTHIINLASLSHVDTSISSPLQFHKYNTASTNALFEAVRIVSSKIPVLHMSTDEVFGSCDKGNKGYNAIYNPSSIYSQTKVSQEQLVFIYRKAYNLNIDIVRATNIYGIMQDYSKFIPKVIKSILDKKPIPLYQDGNQIRTWLHVDDLCRFFDMWIGMKKWDSDLVIKPQEFHVTDPNNEITNLSVIKSIAKAIGTSEYQINFVPDRINHDYRYSLDWGKGISWRPQIYWETGIRDTVQWYKEQLRKESNE